MGFLTKLEKLSEKYIEGFFKNKFTAHIQPAEIAKHLLRAMRDSKNVSVSKVYVPNEYTVLLSQADWETIDSVQHSLSEELQEFVKNKAIDKGYEMVGAPRVSFEQSEDLLIGTVNIRTHFSEEIPPNQPAGEENLPEPVPGQNTLVVDKARFYHNLPQAKTQGTLTRLDAVPRPTAVLVVKMGAKEGLKFPLGRRGVIIGRRRTCDIRLEDTNASRVHASIDSADADYFLTDLGSTNGTYVNGTRISKKKLAAGDLIRIGTTILEFKVV